ncbi:MAG: glycine oxidase ThiO [Bryobacteraceae bacterium]
MSASGFSRAAIAVIGAGIAGMSAAWRLVQRGFRVTVFDRSSVGGEASWAGAGMLAPGGEIEAASSFADLCIESRRLYPPFVRELERDSSVAIDYQECGGLDLAYSLQAASALDARANRQAALGVLSKAVSPARVAAFWPRLDTAGLVSARFYPGDAIVNPRDVMAALTSACRGLGVAVFENSAVRRVEISPAEAIVESDASAASFDLAILAAGAWSSSIAVHGVPPLPAAEPVKGHLIAYCQPRQTCATIVRHGHIYLLQRASGLLIAGASVEHAGFDRALSPEIVAWLAKEAGFLFPHLRETTPSEAWTGFRPASDDLHIGPWHSNRLYLAYGHYRNGILLAPATAGRLASHISANWGTRSGATALPPQ